MKKAIFWDSDGTLLYGNESFKCSLIRAFEEFGYVLEGEVLLVIDKMSYKVKKGETFYFDSSKNHYLKNTKDKLCKIIWVSSPPNF